MLLNGSKIYLYFKIRTISIRGHLSYIFYCMYTVIATLYYVFSFLPNSSTLKRETVLYPMLVLGKA